MHRRTVRRGYSRLEEWRVFMRKVVRSGDIEAVLVQGSLGEGFKRFNRALFTFSQELRCVLQALGFTQPLTEISTRNVKIIMFLGNKVWWVRRADNLTAIYEPIVSTMWDP
jgi:hypothetical protein